MEDFLINKATKQNIEDLKKLRKSHFLYEIEKLGNSLIDINWPYSESSIKDFEYFIDEQIIFLAEYKGRIVGYICGEILPKKDWNLFQIASLTNLFIYSEYRNNGIGTALIEAFKSECSKNNVKYIELNVLYNNTAIEFYKKNGFNVHSAQLISKI